MDLRPYGIDLVFRNTIPKETLVATVLRDGQKTLILRKLDGTTEVFHLGDVLGKGSYGTTIMLKEKIDGFKSVVKIIKTSKTTEIIEAAREFIIQLMCSKETENEEFDGYKGPFVPRPFYFAYSKNEVYLFSEHVESTLIKKIEDKSTPSFELVLLLKEIITQVAKILDILETKDYYNHRDLKVDNIMFSMVDGKPQVKLIDFGFSCLDYAKHNHINALEGRNLFRYECDNKSRDMSSFLFSVSLFLDNVLTDDLCPLKRIWKLLLGPTPRRWSNSYNYYNRIAYKNPNMEANTVYTIFKNIKFISTPLHYQCPDVDPSWVSHIKAINVGMVKKMTGAEKKMIDVAVVQQSASSEQDRIKLMQSIDPTYEPYPFSALCETAKKAKDPATIAMEMARHHSPEFLNGICNESGYTPLHAAAEKGNVEVVRQLLKFPETKVDAQDVKGNTALHIVLLYLYSDDNQGRYDIMRLLLDRAPGLLSIMNEWGQFPETDDPKAKDILAKYKPGFLSMFGKRRTRRNGRRAY